jgi:hypothetical protein
MRVAALAALERPRDLTGPDFNKTKVGGIKKWIKVLC